MRIPCKRSYGKRSYGRIKEINMELDFGQALNAMKMGKKIARKGWNGQNMFVYYVPEASYPSVTKVAKDTFGEFTPYRAYMALKTAQNDVAVWHPSGSDALATDWFVVE